MRAQVGRSLQQVGRRAAQTGYDVVVGHHHAERGVRHDQRVVPEADLEGEQTEVDGARERVLQCDAGDDARQRDGQHQQERDGVLAEELEPGHGECGKAAQHERDHHRCERDLA